MNISVIFLCVEFCYSYTAKLSVVAQSVTNRPSIVWGAGFNRRASSEKTSLQFEFIKNKKIKTHGAKFEFETQIPKPARFEKTNK